MTNPASVNPEEIEALIYFCESEIESRQIWHSERDPAPVDEAQSALSTARSMAARIVELEGLRDDLYKHVSSLVEELDKLNGTPCEQIRHDQESEALKARVLELEAALKPFAGEYDNWSVDRTLEQLNEIDGEKAFDEPDFTVGDLRRARAALKGSDA